MKTKQDCIRLYMHSDFPPACDGFIMVGKSAEEVVGKFRSLASNWDGAFDLMIDELFSFRLLFIGMHLRVLNINLDSHDLDIENIKVIAKTLTMQIEVISIYVDFIDKYNSEKEFKDYHLWFHRALRFSVDELMALIDFDALECIRP